MQAAVVDSLGQPPRYDSFADPQPKDGEALIRVRAAGLHPVVKAMASGSHYAASGELPAIPGVDGVGTLEDGTRVFFGGARKPFGTMCELTVAPRARCLPLPAGLDDAQAAAIVNPGMSAWLSLKERAGLARGETVLILGATGVAGHLAVQAARHMGAVRVIGAGRNVDSLKGENIDAVIGLTGPEEQVREAFAAEAANGVDVVIDFLWGRPAELLLEALAKGFRPDRARTTRWVEVGESAGKTIILPGSTLRSIDLRMLGSGLGSVSLQAVFNAVSTLLETAAEGGMRVDVVPVPLKDVEAAWAREEKGRRIVFMPQM